MERNLTLKIISIACLLFFGCAKNMPTLSAAADSKLYTNTAFMYSIQIPEQAYAIRSLTGSDIGFGTFGILEDPNLEDFGIHIYSFNQKNCPPLAVTKPQQRKSQGAIISFGKVDDYEQYTGDAFAPRIYCAPWKPITSSYVLCSENNDRAVLVCINQVQDNPAIAEEIFSTFHWTK